jgi:uncharacterized protein (DUF362 family)
MKASAMGLAVTATGKLGWMSPEMAQVSLVHVGEGGRSAAIRKAVELVGAPVLSGKSVALKPNFNSAHRFPGGTHNDTLGFMVELIRELGAGEITVADRSGMGDTEEVMVEKGIFHLAALLDFTAIPLDALGAEHWVHMEHPDLHWSRGYYMAKLFQDADSVIQTCCLKTHRFGGHFTMSLKNTVGLVAKRVPGVDHDFMRELHGARNDHQRHMIAEINLCYKPELIVMDAVECFTERGPDDGTRAFPDVILASTDRVAIDAVGVAILREKGTTEEVSQGPVFKQEQLARAAQLGIGVNSAEKVEIITANAEGSRYADRLRAILMAD